MIFRSNNVHACPANANQTTEANSPIWLNTRCATARWLAKNFGQKGAVGAPKH